MVIERRQDTNISLGVVSKYLSLRWPKRTPPRSSANVGHLDISQQPPIAPFNKGLTLIEMLIVCALVSMLGLVLYTSLVNGMKIWQRSQKLVVEEDVVIFFDKISRDMRNSFFHSEISVQGDADSFYFPTIVRVLADPKMELAQGEFCHQIGAVHYYFDSFEKKIYRRQGSYGQATQGKLGSSQALVDSVEDVSFEYLYFSEDKEVLSRAIHGFIPDAVKIEVEFSGTNDSHTLTKFIDIPIGK